jgi:hypothetical protein
VADNKRLSQLKKDKKELQEKDVSGISDRAFDRRIKQEQDINDLIEDRIQLNKEILSNEESYNDALASVGKQLGKNGAYYKEFKKQNEELALSMDEINAILKKSKKLTQEQRDSAQDAAAAYKEGRLGLQSAFAELVKNKDANVDIEEIINQQVKTQKEFAESITSTRGNAGKLKKAFEENVATLEQMGPALKAAAKDMKNIQKLGDKIGHTGFGGIINQGLEISKAVTGKGPGSIGEYAKGQAEKRGAMGLAGQAPKAGSMMGALGGIAKFAGPAALIGTALFGIFKFVDGGGISKIKSAAKMLSGNKMMDEESIKGKAASLEGTEEFRKINAKYNYIKPLEERQTREKELFDYQKQNTVAMIEYENSLVKDELSFQLGLKKDAINFGFQQAMQTMEAEGARRKTLFLTGMSMYKKSLTVSERALNAIGSSAEAVFDSIKEIGLGLGVSLSQQIKMATSAAGLSKTYGSTGEDVLKMTKNFKLMDKSSAKTAFNNVAGLSAFAKLNDLSPAQLFKQMADASEEVMKYSNMTTSQYASQSVLLANMNTSMKDMAVASGTMVLNYKDSIKSEMSLSAMLGKNVNLSEVRARLMSGDMAGGASALKSALGGMDIGAMNAFQKQELSKATGMGVEQLMELTQSKGGGVKGTLQEQAGLKTGEDIARGALKMDVSLAGQRLGMEQAQRKTMLKFEQRERLIMLQLEQAQKLKMLEVEAYFRVKYTKELEMSHEKQMAAAKHLEEMGSGIMMGGGKNLMDQAFAGLDKGSAGYSQASSLNNSISGMIQSGQIGAGDMRLADYYNAQFELAETYKAQPEILAQKLNETYNKIFAEEAKAQKEYDEKVKREKLAGFIREKNDLTSAVQYMELYKEFRVGKSTEQDRQKMSELFKGFGNDMKKTVSESIHLGNGEKLLGDFTDRLKLITGEINKDPKYGSGELLKRPPGMIYPGEPGYGKVDFKSGTIGGMQNLNMFGPGGGFGASGGTTGAPTGGAAPKPVANNYIVDTNSMVTAVNTSSTSMNGYLSQLVDFNKNVVTQSSRALETEAKTLNTNIGALKTLQTNGYLELLRRTDVTNTLLDTLIGATAEASAKPIQINGKRINDVMLSVKQRTYGIGG